VRTFAELDKRQKALIKMVREAPEPGEAQLDIILQEANFAGLTTALRFEEISARAAVKYPALAVIETAKRGIYIGMQEAARRIGTASSNYLEGVRNMIAALSKSTRDGRSVCLALDHAGAVPTERIETVFRAADETAYRLNVAVRLVIVITKVEVWDAATRKHFAAFPRESEILKPRWRAWSYGAREFKFLRAAQKFNAITDEMPLLEEGSNELARAAG